MRKKNMGLSEISLKRRDFIQIASMGALAFSFSPYLTLNKEDNLGIVVHSYGNRWQSKANSIKYPPFKNVIDLMAHSHKIGASGIQVGVNDWAQDYVKQIRAKREKLGLYLEGSISLLKKQEDISKFESDVKNAKEAGAKVLRTVSLGPRRYEALHSYKEFEEFQKNALAALQMAAPVLQKYKMKLGVENHKDWRADELVNVLKNIDNEWIGVTLDYGNSIALLEDPMEVVEKLAPYVVTTHVKDMALEEYEGGFLLSEVPLGQGILDLKKIAALCRKHNPDVTFNLEMITRDPLEIPCLSKDYWKTFNNLPANELAHILKMVKEKGSTLPRVSQLSPEKLLAEEEKNILLSLDYSNKNLILDKN